MPLRIIPLGGLGEFGLNSLLFDDGESAVLVDAGLMFPDDTMLGIDFVIPDFGCLQDVSHRLRALLLTHGHEDHIGAVSFLLKDFDIPVYGTPLTLGLLRNRLEEHGLGDVARLETITRSSRFPIGDLDVETFPVCHSIPGGFGYILRCRDGVFVHTGDFKIDIRPLDGVKTAMDRLAEVAAREKVTALFSDSTNVEREGQSLPEAFVGEALSKIFGEAGGRVIVAMFSSNIHRIQEAINAAGRHNRKVALCGRSMIGNVETALELGYMNLPHPNILVPVEETETLPGREVVVLTTGSQGEPRSALTLMALGEHKYVRIREGDTAVLSSKFIPGNERTISNVINHLFLSGADVRYEKISDIHVSGHASREELRRMVRLLRPEYFIPVHGEPRHLIMHKAFGRGDDARGKGPGGSPVRGRERSGGSRRHGAQGPAPSFERRHGHGRVGHLPSHRGNPVRARYRDPGGGFRKRFRYYNGGRKADRPLRVGGGGHRSEEGSGGDQNRHPEGPAPVLP
jgi:ribonuclease J